MLARVFKDIYPRYKTMRGYRVDRKGGWDCHGLPVEIAVEQELGITSKAEIEAFGIAEFNARCRESVFEFLEDWNRLTERIGFWLDLDDAYRTLDNDYIESVWWALSQLFSSGACSTRVTRSCPTAPAAAPPSPPTRSRSATATWSTRRSTCACRSPRPTGPLQDGDELLVWTTTPWTLVSNAAVAVAPDLIYVRARGQEPDGPVFVLAEALAGAVLGDKAEILDRFPAELVGPLSQRRSIFHRGRGTGAARTHRARG